MIKGHLLDERLPKYMHIREYHIEISGNLYTSNWFFFVWVTGEITIT